MPPRQHHPKTFSPGSSTSSIPEEGDRSLFPLRPPPSFKEERKNRDVQGERRSAPTCRSRVIPRRHQAGSVLAHRSPGGSAAADPGDGGQRPHVEERRSPPRGWQDGARQKASPSSPKRQAMEKPSPLRPKSKATKTASPSDHKRGAPPRPKRTAVQKESPSRPKRDFIRKAQPLSSKSVSTQRTSPSDKNGGAGRKRSPSSPKYEAKEKASQPNPKRNFMEKATPLSPSCGTMQTLSPSDHKRDARTTVSLSRPKPGAAENTSPSGPEGVNVVPSSSTGDAVEKVPLSGRKHGVVTKTSLLRPHREPVEKTSLSSPVTKKTSTLSPKPSAVEKVSLSSSIIDIRDDASKSGPESVDTEETSSDSLCYDTEKETPLSHTDCQTRDIASSVNVTPDAKDTASLTSRSGDSSKSISQLRPSLASRASSVRPGHKMTDSMLPDMTSAGRSLASVVASGASSNQRTACPTMLRAKTRPATSAWEKRRRYQIPSKCRPPPATAPPVHTGKRTYSIRKPPVYVVVQQLLPGAVFGFDQLQLPLLGGVGDVQSARVSLVTGPKGAELITLDKEFFVSHADNNVQHDLNAYLTRYPTPESVRMRYRLQLAGELYMDKVCDEWLEEVKVRLGRRNYGTYFTPSTAAADPEALAGVAWPDPDPHSP